MHHVKEITRTVELKEGSAKGDQHDVCFGHFDNGEVSKGSGNIRKDDATGIQDTVCVQTIGQRVP